MTRRRWIICGLLAMFALCAIFGDKQNMKYRYELYITPIIEYLISPETNPTHTDEGQTDESPRSDTANDTY